MRRRLALPLLLCSVLGTQCFPELPDPGVVDSLRVLAVRSDPAVAVLDTFPLPTWTVTALVVDPADETLAGVTHRWTLDLPDDVEGVEQLAAMIPDPPHGTSIDIDLNALLAGSDRHAARADDDDDPAYLIAALPLRYRAETADDQREAVKIISFLMPDFGGGDDDDATGDDDDATGDDDDSAAARAIDPEDPPAGYNENPTLAALTINGGVYSVANGLLPGPSEPLVLGPVDPVVGLRLDLVVADDKDPDDVWAELYWTAGCPGLPPGEEPAGPFGPGPGSGEAGALDECPDDDAFGFGSSARLVDEDEDDDAPPRAFGWFPLASTADARLFLVLREAEGGQTWQEIRIE